MDLPRVGVVALDVNLANLKTEAFDDGSSQSCRAIFAALGKISDCSTESILELKDVFDRDFFSTTKDTLRHNPAKTFQFRASRECSEKFEVFLMRTRHIFKRYANIM